MKRKGSCVILNAWGKKENYGISFHRVVKVIIFARGNNSTKIGKKRERWKTRGANEDGSIVLHKVIKLAKIITW